MTPGHYWVRFPSHTDSSWTVGRVDEDGDLYVVGWDASLPLEQAQFGPRLEPPGTVAEVPDGFELQPALNEPGKFGYLNERIRGDVNDCVTFDTADEARVVGLALIAWA